MEAEFTEPVMKTIHRWSGIAVPNAAARQGLADLEALIMAVEKVRAATVFEDEPSSFEAALHDLKEAE